LKAKIKKKSTLKLLKKTDGEAQLTVVTITICHLMKKEEILETLIAT